MAPPPPHYAPPGYQTGTQRTNGLAIASLVLSLVFVCGVGSILAVVFGNMARKQIRERGEQGDGLAVAGIVIGWVGIGLVVLYIIGMILLAASDTGTTT